MPVKVRDIPFNTRPWRLALVTAIVIDPFVLVDESNAVYADNVPLRTYWTFALP
jgi:hypothetical protein